MIRLDTLIWEYPALNLVRNLFPSQLYPPFDVLQKVNRAPANAHSYLPVLESLF